MFCFQKKCCYFCRKIEKYEEVDDYIIANGMCNGMQETCI